MRMLSVFAVALIGLGACGGDDPAVVTPVNTPTPDLDPVAATSDRSGEDGFESIVEVKDRPLFERGQFKSITKGAPEIERGLLVGTPDGLSFQYRIDDVRLLGVRQGQFVKRSYWTGRGSTPLEPLGKIIRLVGGGNPPPMFELRDEDGKSTPLKARLHSTNSETGASLSYDLIDSEVVASVTEQVKAISIHNLSGYVRYFRIKPGNLKIHLVEGTVVEGTGTVTEGGKDTGIWNRSGAVLSWTMTTHSPSYGGPPGRPLDQVVLLLPDPSDETFEKLAPDLSHGALHKLVWENRE